MKTKNYKHKRRTGGKSKRCSKRCSKRTQRRVRARRGGNMFRGSYPSASVVCLAGSSKIPCTAFSAA